MPSCILGARMNMSALIVRQGVASDGNSGTGTPNQLYEYNQDPWSGAVIRDWVPDVDTDDSVPGVQPSTLSRGSRTRCAVRGMADGGIRVAGTGERFSSRGTIETVDFVTMKYPAEVIITRRDRVTDIRNRAGKLIWTEEEFSNAATIFEVNGVTPILDPFGTHIENSALLQRAEQQGVSI